MKPRVIKVGGRALAERSWLERFARALPGVSVPTVVVHGGGHEVTRLCERLGIGDRWVDGLRVTTPATLDAAVMVLSGRVNKALVAALLRAGTDAIGLSGEDGGLLVAEPAADAALGRVGERVRVRSGLLRRLLELGPVPVLSPISCGADGARLNVNADEAAAAVASALGASTLLFVTDVPGVWQGGATRRRLTPGAARELVAAGAARDGMAVKLGAAERALAVGVGAVRIGPLAMLSDETVGTYLEPGAGGAA